MTISDIVNRIYTYTKTNSSSFPAATMLLAINQAYNRAVSLILQADGRWEWDDDNQTDLPIATTSIVASQQDYSIDVNFLKIQRVEIKQDGATQYTKLEPLDTMDGGDIIDNTSTGAPAYYDIKGSSIYLFPVPNYSQAASLKVYVQRGPDEFTSAEVTTGTKAPGFNSLYHEIIPLQVAADYWLANDQSKVTGFENKVQKIEEQIVKDYSKRDKDDRHQITTEYTRHR